MATENDEQLTEIPEGYREFTKFRDSGELPDKTEAVEEKPAVGEEETPPSEPADEAGQIAEESDPEEEAEQEEEETQEEEKPKGKPGNRGLARRMRELTGEIKALKSRLEEQGEPADVDDEATGEVVSPPETVAATAEDDAEAPMLKDYEDNDEQSSWDQYEAATKAFNKAATAKAIQVALTKQGLELEAKHTKETLAQAKVAADADWNKAASRFPNYNEVVRADVKISQAMETVMRMDPVTGTELAMYLGEHPEESEAIAKETLATSDKEWGNALARAGMKLGEIRANLKTPAKGNKPAAPAPTPIKKVTSAHKPPPIIRGGTAAPAFDVLNEDDAANTGKWIKERNRQLALAGKR